MYRYYTFYIHRGGGQCICWATDGECDVFGWSVKGVKRQVEAESGISVHSKDWILWGMRRTVLSAFASTLKSWIWCVCFSSTVFYCWTIVTKYVGLARTEYTPYMTVYMVISLPETLYRYTIYTVYIIYVVLVNPTSMSPPTELSCCFPYGHGQIHTHTHTHSPATTYIYTCMHTEQTYTNEHTRTHTHTHAHTHAHTCTHTNKHTHKHTNTHTHHTHTHTHTHTSLLPL